MILAVTAGILWFFFRNYREEARVKNFISSLEQKDFKTAYTMWGCTEAMPCRDYSFERFMEDWGPKSAASDPASIRREAVKSCEGGIIQILRLKDQEVMLFVDRQNLQIGFSPWPTCTPRVQI